MSPFCATISRREKDGAQPITAQKLWSFPLSISSVNVTKSSENCKKLWSHLLRKYLMENFIFCAVNYFLYGVFDQFWYEFQLKYLRLCFGFCKTEVPDSVSRDLWCYQNWHEAIENSESKKVLNLASHFFLWWRLRGLLKWLKEKSFCERKEEIITKKWTLLGRKISYYEFFG